MKSSHQIEFAAGLFLLLGIASLIFLAIQATDSGSELRGGSYELTASFGNVGGLRPRAKVSMAGVTVGTVDRIELDPDTLDARVTLRISDRYNDIPDDTSAAILTSGILGDQYVGLEPGGSPEPMREGDRFLITQSAVVLEQLIGRFMMGGGGDDE